MCWVLAFGPSDDPELTALLVDAAKDDIDQLRRAHEARVGTPVGDKSARQRAADLLLAAAAALERRPSAHR